MVAQAKHSPGRRLLERAADRPWIFVGSLLAVLLVVLYLKSQGEPHNVYAVFDSAVSVVPGLDVNLNGTAVGQVSSVRVADGRALVGLGLSDSAWPLHQGTIATIRYGTTIGNGTRRIDLTPGQDSAPAIPQNGTIVERYTTTPVEFDQVFNTFDSHTRAQLRSMLSGMGSSLGPVGPELNKGLHSTAPALSSLSGVMGQLGLDQSALAGLLRSTDAATATLAAHQGQIESLVSSAAASFNTLASRSHQIDQSLDLAPAGHDDARAFLHRLNPSVDKLDTLIRDLAPGAAELVPVAQVARPAVAQLRADAPALEKTLATARAAAPQITKLLSDAQPFATGLTPSLTSLAPMVGCIRPYTPELTGLLTHWVGWASDYDALGHYGRIQILAGPTSDNATIGLTPAAFASATGQQYAYPRPAGLSAGHPVFNAACGITQTALNPVADPEGAR
jgi:ABC-type transporter Mla subunit MlaD